MGLPENFQMRMNSRFQIIAVFVLSIFTMWACGEDTIVTTTPATEQKLIDLEIIADYIQEKGYSQVDTTKNGVRYVILNEGNGSPIKTNDIVHFYVAGKLTDGTLFITNIDTAAVNADSYDSTASYEPIIYSYSTTGWTVPNLYSSTTELGYKEGLSKVFGLMKTGGRAQLIVPSGVGFGAAPPSKFIPQNSVLVYDLYPTYVK